MWWFLHTSFESRWDTFVVRISKKYTLLRTKRNEQIQNLFFSFLWSVLKRNKACINLIMICNYPFLRFRGTGLPHPFGYTLICSLTPHRTQPFSRHCFHPAGPESEISRWFPSNLDLQLKCRPEKGKQKTEFNELQCLPVFC